MMMSHSQRNSLKTSDFALPKQRAYPIHDASHARDALSRVSQYGTPTEQAQVRAAVKRRYPKMSMGGMGGMGGGMTPNEAPSRMSM